MKTDRNMGQIWEEIGFYSNCEVKLGDKPLEPQALIIIQPLSKAPGRAG